MSKRVTKREKREFIRRCKELAERHGERSRYRPARWLCRLFEDLSIRWEPDSEYLNVTVGRAKGDPLVGWHHKVVVEFRGQCDWSHTHKVHHYLELMRQLMVLDDLADV